jgi:hypothetical protein
MRFQPCSHGRVPPPTRSHTYDLRASVNPFIALPGGSTCGVDASGKPAEGICAQAVQVFKNIKTALASVGGGFEHIVKLTSLPDQHG